MTSTLSPLKSSCLTERVNVLLLLPNLVEILRGKLETLGRNKESFSNQKI